MKLALAVLLLVPLPLLALLKLLTPLTAKTSNFFVSTQPHAIRTKLVSIPAEGAEGKGFLAVEDGQYVNDGGPVLLACGQGKSLYDVKGCLSSWVLLGDRGGGAQSDVAREKLAAADGGIGAGGTGI